MSKLEVVPIRNIIDAERVRVIRNSLRNYMTNSTSYISPFGQLKWYLNIYKKENKNGKMDCYSCIYKGKTCGYGLIRIVKGKYFLTGGITENQRGKGFGEELFKKLIELVPEGIVWLEVLDTNTIAKRLYLKLGFRKVDEKLIKKRKVIIMKLVKEKNGKV